MASPRDSASAVAARAAAARILAIAASAPRDHAVDYGPGCSRAYGAAYLDSGPFRKALMVVKDHQGLFAALALPAQPNPPRPDSAVGRLGGKSYSS